MSERFPIAIFGASGGSRGKCLAKMQIALPSPIVVLDRRWNFGDKCYNSGPRFPMF